MLLYFLSGVWTQQDNPSHSGGTPSHWEPTFLRLTIGSDIHLGDACVLHALMTMNSTRIASFSCCSPRGRRWSYCEARPVPPSYIQTGVSILEMVLPSRIWTCCRRVRFARSFAVHCCTKIHFYSLDLTLRASFSAVLDSFVLD